MGFASYGRMALSFDDAAMEDMPRGKTKPSAQAQFATKRNQSKFCCVKIKTSKGSK